MLFIDTETFSDIPITHGTHRYAERVEIMVTAFAFDDGDVMVMDHTRPDAARADVSLRSAGNVIRFAIKNGHKICFHNSHFDRTVLRHAGIDIPTEHIVDTMVMAFEHGLPGSLDRLGTILRVPMDQAKSKEGKRLIQLFCKPRPARQKLRRATRDTHPKEWAEFLEYARLDIEAMRAVYKKLPKFNDEAELWQLDQRINDRGVLIDMDLVRAAIDLIGETKASLDGEAQAITLGTVGSANQRNAVMDYLKTAFGIPMDDLKASTVEAMLEDDNYPSEVRELLRIRLAVSTTSTAKYKRLENVVSSDCRLRGSLQFAGASRTRRWAGRLFQPQNLPRPTMEADEIEEHIEAIKFGCLLHPNPMDVLSNALRGAIIAPPGCKLAVADLSNIEGRVLAWLAGEAWKIKAFEQFDDGEGPDLYKVAAGRILAKPPEKIDKDERQAVGKVSELALGYAGGVGAFLTFATAYGLDLADLAQKARRGLPRPALQASEQLYGLMLKKKLTHGLDRETWVAIDGIKQAWRTAHEATTAFWERLEECAKIAIVYPGREAIVNEHIKMIKTGGWLRVILPSGGELCYAAPIVQDGKIRYMGINQYNRKFERIATYGGKLAENIVQATARDVLAYGMRTAEDHGYEIVLSVHDELITEVPDTDEYSGDELALLMAQNPPWAKGLPLAAGGFDAPRYRK